MTTDLAQHQRERIQRLERRVDGLTRYRDQLERAYALACVCLAGTTCDPCQVAAVIHEIAEAPAQGIADEDLKALLRETAA